MAKTDYKTINDYHNAFGGETLQRMTQIRTLIHQVAPHAQEIISYQIPAFKLNEKNYLIYYSAYAKHISLSSPWSNAFLAHFAEQLKNYKVSKSAIQLPNNKPLPVELITQILQFRKQELENKK